MRRFPRHGFAPVWILCCLAAASSFAQAQTAPPTISSTSPQAAAPGQTVDIKIESKDVLWEVQRLVDILHDPDQRFAGLVMSYTDSGERLINPVWAPVLPVFTRLGA